MAQEGTLGQLLWPAIRNPQTAMTGPVDGSAYLGGRGPRGPKPTAPTPTQDEYSGRSVVWAGKKQPSARQRFPSHKIRAPKTTDRRDTPTHRSSWGPRFNIPAPTQMMTSQYQDLSRWSPGLPAQGPTPAAFGRPATSAAAHVPAMGPSEIEGDGKTHGSINRPATAGALRPRCRWCPIAEVATCPPYGGNTSGFGVCVQLAALLCRTRCRAAQTREPRPWRHLPGA